jgi:hypothetical protein
MEKFMKATGTEMTHVPYKGGAGQAIPAMVAGEVQLAFFNMASLLPHIKSGRLKALAAIPTQRLPELPNVPTLAEQGFPGIGTNAWQGMFAPAATPKPWSTSCTPPSRLHSDALIKKRTRQADDECGIVKIADGFHGTGAKGNAGLGRVSCAATESS